MSNDPTNEPLAETGFDPEEHAFEPDMPEAQSIDLDHQEVDTDIDTGEEDLDVDGAESF